VAFAGTVSAAVLLGLAGTTWQAAVAREQRDLALAAREAEAEQREVAESERAVAIEQTEVARREAARALAMSDFLQQVLIAPDPVAGESRDVTVREVLMKASENAGETLEDQPMIEAEVRSFLGNTLASLGQVNEGIEELRIALQLREGTPDENGPDQAASHRGLGEALADRGDRQSAAANYASALEILLTLGDEHAYEAVTVYTDLARTCTNLSRYQEAEDALADAEELYAAAELDLPSALAYIAEVRSMLATYWREDAELAERYAEESLAHRREAADDVLLLYALNNVAVSKMRRGDFDEAVAIFQEAIEASERVYGEVHQRIAVPMENLANVHYQQGDYDRSLAMLQEVAAMRDAALGEGSLAGARTRVNMSSVALRMEDYRRALELIDDVRPVFKSQIGETSLEYATLVRGRAKALEGLGDLDGALIEYRAELAIHDAINAPTNSQRLRSLVAVTNVLCGLGRSEEARAGAAGALSLLDPADESHARWIEEFNQAREDCGS